MSLSADERQALHTIEDGLAGCYPGLAEKLSAFTRLAADDEMPGHETVSPPEPHVMTAQRRGYRRHDQPEGLLLWLALAVAVIAASGFGLAASHTAGRPCTDSFTLVCAERTIPNQPRRAGHQAGPPGRLGPLRTRSAQPG
jgi:hypothetical protein